MGRDSTVLVANRGEIALRIIRTATEFGYRTAAVYADDDSHSPHVSAAHRAVRLSGSGPQAYLDMSAVVAAAETTGSAMIHPGYGFLSESSGFARAVTAAGRVFVGPTAEVLALFGDKSAARRAAIDAGLPVLPATPADSSLEQVRDFLTAHPAGIMVKALSGGGGRGMREVRNAAEVDAAYRHCTAEARSGFGDPAVYAEVLIDRVRHIEVQIVAAPCGAGVRALALGDRDCSVQRRHQKLLEIAPAPELPDALRAALHRSAAHLCSRAGLCGLATVEFLVRESGSGHDPEGFFFLEVNPRIQVEHTVTEETTGVDLVAAQLAIARGAHFDELDLPAGVVADPAGVSGAPAVAAGVAVQCRINAETTAGDGSVAPASGTLAVFTPATGPGVRVDTYGRPGLAIGTRYDSLLAKLIAHVHTNSLPAAVHKAAAALGEFVIDGVDTNIDVLRAICAEPTLLAAPVTTDWLSRTLPGLDGLTAARPPATGVVAVGRLQPGEQVVSAPLTGTVVEVAEDGAEVRPGTEVVVLEAMKMQHPVSAPVGARRVSHVLVEPGHTVQAGDPLLVIVVSGTTGQGQHADERAADGAGLDMPRADLDEITERHRLTRDEARPDAVAKRHRRGRRTARENIADLVDQDSFIEYGPLALAAQRTRRSEADLIAGTPADGLIAGTATVNAATFGGRSAVAVLSYDYTVLAGTQGMRNHAKTDRVLDVATRRGLPVVFFTEGGGGRPGDTDAAGMAGLDLMTFRALAALRGRVPLVAIVSGRCFAGNAALAGVCDVIIATPDANIGMGGPAMIEGGGLGVWAPEDIGPADVQRRNGVIDVVTPDEAHAVAVARQYLSYFQGAVEDWRAPDPRLARYAVPQNRLRAYDVRRAVESVADVGSVLELRADYGLGVVTALVRVEGAPYGLLANNSAHLGGALDAEAADKAADFLQLCEASGLPLISLCDTPGFMVGPAAEEQAGVRRFGRFFTAGARLTVPLGMIILRKGYGLGAMAMAGGSFHAPEFTVAWPTGEIGPMGLEGAVRLGFRKELDAVEDPDERRRLFEKLLAAAYQHGKALQSATTFELDDVIDPAQTRAWIATLRRRCG